MGIGWQPWMRTSSFTSSTADRWRDPSRVTRPDDRQGVACVLDTRNGFPRLLANLGRRSRQEAANQSSRVVKNSSLLENHEGHEESRRHSPLCRPLSVSRTTVETRVACLRPGSRSRGTRNIPLPDGRGSEASSVTIREIRGHSP